MNKQTSIEWLVKELNQAIDYIPINKWDAIADIIQQAKQMHKDEITIAYGSDRFPCSDADCEDYYQETYGGSPKEISEEKPMRYHCVPKEISDEEIIKLANKHILYNDSKRQWVIEGMKLYKEQLKGGNK